MDSLTPSKSVAIKPSASTSPVQSQKTPLSPPSTENSNPSHTRRKSIPLSSSSNCNSRRAWTSEEDAALIDLVETVSKSSDNKDSNKINVWKHIQYYPLLVHRTPKQCRERYNNHLNPSVNKSPFKLTEDEIIVSQHRAIGPKWSNIAKLLPGRTDNSIKNRFNSTFRKANKLVKSMSLPDNHFDNTNNNLPNRLYNFFNSEEFEYDPLLSYCISLVTEKNFTITENNSNRQISYNNSILPNNLNLLFPFTGNLNNNNINNVVNLEKNLNFSKNLNLDENVKFTPIITDNINNSTRSALETAENKVKSIYKNSENDLKNDDVMMSITPVNINPLSPIPPTMNALPNMTSNSSFAVCTPTAYKISSTSNSKTPASYLSTINAIHSSLSNGLVSNPTTGTDSGTMCYSSGSVPYESGAGSYDSGTGNNYKAVVLTEYFNNTNDNKESATSPLKPNYTTSLPNILR